MATLGLERFFGLKVFTPESLYPDQIEGATRRIIYPFQRKHQNQFRISENNKKLESLFQNHVHVSKEKQLKYLNLLENILNPIIKLMEETSPEFKKAYSGSSYCGGSFFDGLK